MAKDGLTDNLGDQLLKVHTLRYKISKSPLIQKEKTATQNIASHLIKIRKTNDPALILKAERLILTDELEYRSNDPIQVSSLQASIESLDATIKLFEKVRDPQAYKSVDEEHSTRKRRSGGLPLDQAREFFLGHNARLMNLKKATLTEEDKNLLDIRRENIRTVAKTYVQEQKKTLGLSIKETKSQSLSR